MSRKVQQLNSWGGGYVLVIIISNYVMLSSASHNSVLVLFEFLHVQSLPSNRAIFSLKHLAGQILCIE